MSPYRLKCRPPDGGIPISAVISDCGLAASYMVPSPTKPRDYKSFLVTYTWDDDSTKLQNTLAQWPEHISPPGPDAMFDAMLNRAYRQDPANPTTASKWWLYGVLAKVIQTTDHVSWDLSTHITAGGFKLDMTGDHNQSNLCFRFYSNAAGDPDAL
jgi:phenylalanine 2-monooxygenase